MATNDEPLIFGLAKRHYQDLENVFKRYPDIQQVIIFGSRAKNTAKPDSDFDLAIQAPTMTEQTFETLWIELTDLPIIFKLDILHLDKIVNPLLKEKILREGKVFYPIIY